MSELADMHRESSDASWRMDCPKAALKSARSSSKAMHCNDSLNDGKENGCDMNGNITDDCSQLDGNKKSLSTSDSMYKDGSGNNSDDCNSGSQRDCGGCKSCHCRCSGVKRKCSTSDIAFKASDLFAPTNTIPLKRNVLGGSGGVGKSNEKIDKINLANLVFNPNFKNSSGCVNLPVIRAGQNLAQKNAQRSALTMAKDAIKDVVNNNTSTNDLNTLTQQAAIDLLTQQLQPQSLTKLSAKLQQLSQQRIGKPDIQDDSTMDVLQSLAAKQSTTQSNALRYKTELCRSYEEGGECRFGTACTFAHGPEELRPVPRHPLYKTEFCRTYHQHGYCQYGTRCHFIHDADEADKNAPLKGCKSWGRHDQLSGALLSLASSSGLLDMEQQQAQNAAAASASNNTNADNDVLLANLRRLYALRMMNGQENKNEQSAASVANSQFSMSQPMAQQLSMAHQQIASAHGHVPLSMTQPLPMEALQLGLQRAGQMQPHMAQRQQMGQMPPHSRVESLTNDYAQWGVAPQSPTYSGLSPFGNYQQFSPLPHHPGQAPQHQGYPHYPFSATAPDLSAALSVSPYGVSPQGFSNTVNVGHMLADQNGNFQMQAGASNPNMPKGTIPVNAPHAGMGNPVWPPTSAEVSGVIDKELFGFGLDSQGPAAQAGSYQQYPHPFFQSMNQQQQQQKSQMSGHDSSRQNYSGSSQQKNRQGEVDLLSLINNDKYAAGKDSRHGMRTIAESDEGRDQSVRPKVKRSNIES